jgi:hypothetical protein
MWQVKRQIFFGFQKMMVVAVLDGIADELDYGGDGGSARSDKFPSSSGADCTRIIETWVHPGGHQELASVVIKFAITKGVPLNSYKLWRATQTHCENAPTTNHIRSDQTIQNPTKTHQWCLCIANLRTQATSYVLVPLMSTQTVGNDLFSTHYSHHLGLDAR